MIKILFIGESWMVHTTETKGFDVFTYDRYEEAVGYLRDAVTAGGNVDFHYIPSHRVDYDFPKTQEELDTFDVVMISDCGANTFNLPMKTFVELQRMPNKLRMLREYVKNGGGFCMIGGYLTFQGIQARGAYKGTPIEEILPVELLTCDDRRENCQGVVPVVKQPAHSIFKALEGTEWPCLLGYNKLIPKADAEILAEVDGDPLLVLGTYGKGRSCAWASDCAPHWAPVDFCEWKGYAQLWNGIAEWLANKQA